MKTVTKVFLMIATISCAVSCGANIVLGLILTFTAGPAGLIYVLAGLLLIPGIIFGRMGLKSLGDDIKSKALGVLLIIFTGIVPGILFLCWTPDSEAVIKPKVKLDVDTKTDFKVGDKVMVMQENGEETTEVPGVISGYDYSLKIYTISLEGDKKTYASARKIKKAK